MNTNTKRKIGEPLPKNDIGPIYKWMAGIAIFIALGITGLHAWKGQPLGLYDTVFIGIIALLCLALWRPYQFDQLMKTIADKLPAFSYTKNA